MAEDNGIDSDEEHMPEMRLSTTDNSIEEIEENVTLIWFNPVVNPTNDNEKIKEDLRVINDVVLFPTDTDSCITDIESRKTGKIFLIISANNAPKLPPNILDLPQLDSIFIYPENRAESDHLRNKYPKVVDVFDNASELLISMTENITQSNTPLKILSFYDRYQQGTRDLSGQPPGFLWFQLFKDVIQNSPDGDKANAKEEMLTTCRRYYENREQKLKSIDEFDQTYHIDECIRWYTKNTFVYQLINKALRTEDIEQLYIFRYYVADLSKQLAEKHAIMKKNDEKKITLYRGSSCNKKEIEKLTAAVGKLVAINSYWSTSRKRSCALTFANKWRDRPDIAPVLFEIECDLQDENDSVIFADISSLSEFQTEEEFLFDAGSIFQIEEIRKEEKDDTTLTVVKIRTSEKGREVVETHIKLIRQEMEYESPRIMLGILLKRIGKYKKSLEYYKKLLENPGEEKISHIYNRMGIAVRNENKDGLALEYFDTAYDLTCKLHPSERIYLAFIRHNQGQIYAKQRNYAQALTCYEDAVKIIKEELNDTNRYIAEYYSSIGRVYLYQKDHKSALDYQRKALRIRELCLPSNHVNHAFSYVEIAKIFSLQKNYEKASKYHLRALELRQNYLLPNHVSTAYSLRQVGKMYYEMGDSETARNYYKESLEMTRKCLPASGHYITPSILKAIALTYDYNNPKKALDYRLEAFEIQSNIKRVNYSSLARLLDDIASTYKLLDRKEAALIYYEEALKIRETYFYDDKFKLARLYDIIASVYKSMGKKKDSLEFYQKALQIRETYFYDDRFELARTLDGLASVCEEMGKIRWALNSYYKIMRMCTHHYHSYHWLCKKTRRNIERIEGMLK